MHPNSPDTSGDRTPVEQWPVRRWVVSDKVSGGVKISGTLAKQNTSCGDGITGKIFVDGKEIYSQAIAASDSTGVKYSLDLSLTPTSKVDFVVIPGGSDHCDTTTFTAIISGPQPTPKPKPTPEPADNACKEGTERVAPGSNPEKKVWQLPDANGEVKIKITPHNPLAEHAVPGVENFFKYIMTTLKIVGELADEAGVPIIKIPMKYFEKLAEAGDVMVEAGKRLSDKLNGQIVDIEMKFPYIERTLYCAQIQKCQKGKWVPVGIKPVEKGSKGDWIPANIRRASLRGQIHTELSPQELQKVAQQHGISVEELTKDGDFDPYLNLKVVLVEEGDQLKIGYFEFLPPSIMD